MASTPGPQAARPLGHEHAQDHQGDGARRLGAAAARAGADRDDAPVRRPDARADGRRPRARPSRCSGLPLLSGASRRRGDRAAHGRPRPRGRVQLADRSAARSRSAASSQAEGQTVRWLAVGQEGPLDAALPPATSVAGDVGRLQRPAGLHGRAGDRARAGRAVRRRRGRPRRRRLQPLRVAARPAGDRAGRAADPRARSRPTRRSARDDAPPRRLHLRARARGDPRGLLPVYLETSSTARCSNRRPRNRARG